MENLHFTFVHGRYRKEDKWNGDQSNNSRRFQYDICDALNMTKLSVTRGKLVSIGMDPRIAELYHMQASALLAQLTSEKDRIIDDHPDIGRPPRDPNTTI